MVAGVLASLAELELELGRERRTAAREARRARGQAIGRPKALDASKAALARRMHSSGEPVSTIANTLARFTCHRVPGAGRGRRDRQESGAGGLMTSKSVRTQIIGAAGEVLITYKLLKFGIDGARTTTDAGVDLVNVYTRQPGSGDDSGQDELGCGARWR